MELANNRRDFIQVESTSTRFLLLGSYSKTSRPMMAVSLDLKDDLDSGDRIAPFSALQRNDMPEYFENLVPALYLHTCGCMRVYGETTSCVRQFRPISLFFFKVLLDKTTEVALTGLQEVGFQMLIGDQLCYQDSADEIVWIFKSTKNAQRAIDRLSIRRVLHPQILRCFVGLDDNSPALILDGEELTTLACFTYLSSCVIKDDSTALKVNRRLPKGRAACAGLKQVAPA